VQVTGLRSREEAALRSASVACLARGKGGEEGDRGKENSDKPDWSSRALEEERELDNEYKVKKC